MSSIAVTLRDAATSIENGFWYRGITGGSAETFVVTRDHVYDGRRVPEHIHGGGCLFTALCGVGASDPAHEFLRRFLRVKTDKEIFQLNDSQMVNGGWQRAIDVFRNAAKEAEALGV